ncbi:MAG: F0F1 ATP synthase subunit delta [Alphaproteobacteria bacterium]|nr:F0F1 ATP synthase subunit delta [Alphaproteobacteria bacterium]
MPASAETLSGPRLSAAALRYADAIFDLAVEQGAVEVVEDDFRSLKSMVAGGGDFRGFLKSPVYDAEDKAAAIAAVAERAGLSQLTSNFLKLVARNRRLFALEEMVAAFFARLSDYRGEVAAEAISAAPLNDDQAKRLRGEIERYVGKAVNLSTSVDPDLLGGIVVKVGSTMVDSSLRSKLNRLKTKLKEA